MAARAFRQPHYLSRAAHAASGVAPRRGPPVARRAEPAVGGVPGGKARQARATAPGRQPRRDPGRYRSADARVPRHGRRTARSLRRADADRRSGGGVPPARAARGRRAHAAVLQPRGSAAARDGRRMTTGGALYRIDHETRYAHADLVSTSQHVACLRPRDLPYQRVHWHELVVKPEPAHQTRRTDSFGNEVTHLSIVMPYLKLCASSRSLVEVFAVPAVDPVASPPWEDVRDVGHAGVARAPIDVEQFRYASPSTAMAPELTAFALEAFTPGKPLLVAAIDLMHQIHRECRFDPGATSITTPV